MHVFLSIESFILSVFVPLVYTATTSHGDLRLVQGNVTVSGLFASSGCLEIYISGSWGTVCSDNDVNNDDTNSWGLTEANVACRQLGYRRAAGYGQAKSSGFGSGNGQILLNDVDCTSDDTELLSCSHNLGGASCSHADDISVYCTNALEDGPLAGTLIGTTAGALCLLATCCVNIYYLRKKRQRRKAASTHAPTTTTATTDHALNLPQPKETVHYKPQSTPYLSQGN